MEYRLTIVVPVYNEEDNLLRVESEFNAYFKTAKAKSKVLFVNDGSADSSQQFIEEICKRNAEFSFISFKFSDLVSRSVFLQK